MDTKRLNKIRRSLGDTNKDKQLFTDEEINEVLEESESDNYVLYFLYTQKAGRIIENESYIKSIKAGNEELEKLNALDLQKMALEQAKEYGRLYAFERNLNEESSFLY